MPDIAVSAMVVAPYHVFAVDQHDGYARDRFVEDLAASKLFNIPPPDMTDQTIISRYWNALERIRCPILEVRGRESVLVSHEVMARMKSVAKVLTSVDVPGAGHVVTVDKPAESIEATRAFLGVTA